ncbi:MAG TPA: chemotaxis response regulator protein-glutamate methylesterase [Nitrospira sp.]|nr:chemotaxis response regulator protein-glutamate methylesterase [Nitrospira sp.]
MMGRAIQVLVVDDSTFMRKSLSTMLASDRRIAIAGMARNGEEALQQVHALRPDVVTMDVEMPGMNGLEALKRIMAEHPVPVVMVSSLTTEGAGDTLKALELGAVDYIAKQLDGVATKIERIHDELIEKIIAVSQAGEKVRAWATAPGRSAPRPRTALTAHSVSVTRGARLVAIGCSTGGPQALLEVLPGFPSDFPAPILIVQHMPKTFTKPFAERMNSICSLEVKEAADGDELKPGRILIAPGGLQCRVKRKSIMSNVVALSPNFERHLHAPSVDVMMQSVADVYEERGIAVILTGMGHDGLDGMRAVKAVNGRTIAQDEATSIVYGMPKAVAEAGYADKVIPLFGVVGEILNMV